MCLNRSLRKGKHHSLSTKAHLNHCYKHSEKGVLQRELLLHQRKQPAPQKQSSDLASATTWCFKSRAINQSQNEFIIFTSLTIRSSLWAALNDNSGTLISTSKDCHAIMSGARAGSRPWHAQRPVQGSQDQQRSHPSPALLTPVPVPMALQGLSLTQTELPAHAALQELQLP